MLAVHISESFFNYLHAGDNFIYCKGRVMMIDYGWARPIGANSPYQLNTGLTPQECARRAVQRPQVRHQHTCMIRDRLIIDLFELEIKSIY